MSGERRLITAEGYTLSAEQEDAVLARIRGRRSFATHEIVRWLLEGGVPRAAIPPRSDPWGPVGRVADRLLQRERGLGHIVHRKGCWHNLERADG